MKKKDETMSPRNLSLYDSIIYEVVSFCTYHGCFMYAAYMDTGFFSVHSLSMYIYIALISYCTTNISCYISMTISRTYKMYSTIYVGILTILYYIWITYVPTYILLYLDVSTMKDANNDGSAKELQSSVHVVYFIGILNMIHIGFFNIKYIFPRWMRTMPRRLRRRCCCIYLIIRSLWYCIYGISTIAYYSLYINFIISTTLMLYMYVHVVNTRKDLQSDIIGQYILNYMIRYRSKKIYIQTSICIIGCVLTQLLFTRQEINMYIQIFICMCMCIHCIIHTQYIKVPYNLRTILCAFVSSTYLVRIRTHIIAPLHMNTL